MVRTAGQVVKVLRRSAGTMRLVREVVRLVLANAKVNKQAS